MEFEKIKKVDIKTWISYGISSMRKKWKLHNDNRNEHLLDHIEKYGINNNVMINLFKKYDKMQRERNVNGMTLDQIMDDCRNVLLNRIREHCGDSIFDKDGNIMNEEDISHKELDNIRKDAEIIKQRYEKIEIRSKDYKNKFRLMRDDNKKLNTRISNIEAELNESKRQYGLISITSDNLQKTCQVLHQTCTNLQLQANFLNDDKNALVTSNEQFKLQLASLNDSNLELKDEIFNMGEEMRSEFEQQNELLIKSELLLQTKCDTQNAYIKEINIKHETLKEEYRTFREKIEKEISMLRGEKEEQNVIVTNLQNQITRIEDEQDTIVTNLQNQISSLEDERGKETIKLQNRIDELEKQKESQDNMISKLIQMTKK